MIFKGLKFGMILQLAIGPVCLFIFNVGGNEGFINAEMAVVAVSSVDALYILLAMTGTAVFIKKKNLKSLFGFIGAIIIAIFGLKTLLEVFGLRIIPEFGSLNGMSFDNPFIEGLILTVANPLTILFWAGVFSAKISEENMTRKDAYLFGTGSVMATLIFLTVIAVMGSWTRYFLADELIMTLNCLVGVLLIYFAFRLIFKISKY